MVGIENDWKLFKEKLPIWQEKYIEKKIEEYKRLLNMDLPASSKFWELDKLIKNDKHNPGVLVTDRLSRNSYDDIVSSLVAYKVITIDDLDGFSDDFIDAIKLYIHDC